MEKITADENRALVGTTLDDQAFVPPFLSSPPAPACAPVDPPAAAVVAASPPAAAGAAVSGVTLSMKVHKMRRVQNIFTIS